MTPTDVEQEIATTLGECEICGAPVPLDDWICAECYAALDLPPAMERSE
jgi:hypothetical protein